VLGGGLHWVMVTMPETYIILRVLFPQNPGEDSSCARHHS
jgi:hypothetical protein